MNHRPRVMGLIAEASVGRDRQTPVRAGATFDQLGPDVDLQGVHSVALSRIERTITLATNPRMGRRSWSVAASMSPLARRRRSRRATEVGAEHSPAADVILQIYATVDPGREVPYLIYTDNTVALSKRHWPEWAPVGQAAYQACFDHEIVVTQNAASVLTYSEFARRSIIDDYGVDADRVVAIGAGVDIADRYETPDYEAETALFVGLEFERKGVPELLAAWEIVRRSRPNAQLVIVGPKREIPTAGVTWHQRVQPEMVAPLMARASVFVMPSRYEPWGHIFQEAMSMGLGCVATTAGGIPENVLDGRTGLLSQPGNIDALAANLDEALDGERARALGTEARMDVQRRSRWEHVREPIVAAITSASRTNGQ